MDPISFLADLRAEVLAHRAVRHPVLGRFATAADRGAFLRFGLQHQRLVGRFTTYLEHLLLRAPDATDKLWIAKVLVDEYGEGSDGHDHASLYRAFLCGLGATGSELDAAFVHPAVAGFVAEHLRLVRDEPWLVGLGAVGPGHEWAIPAMFPPLVAGLRRLAVDAASMRYFPLHLQQDVEHGRWLEEALLRHARDTAACAAIRAGALASLAARERFWDAIGSVAFADADGAPTAVANGASVG